MSTVYISRPSSTRFQARVRYRGFRIYKLIGKPSRSCVAATMRMAKAMTNKNYKRGDVIMMADYYDPIVVLEMVRR